MSMSVLPRDIDTKNPYGFMGSRFQNTECEVVARNVVLLQKKRNPTGWTDFTWSDYQSFCTHHVSDAERGVLDAMVQGGKPVWNTSAVLSAGYLEKHGDHYCVTKKFVDALPADIKSAVSSIV